MVDGIKLLLNYRIGEFKNYNRCQIYFSEIHNFKKILFSFYLNIIHIFNCQYHGWQLEV